MNDDQLVYATFSTGFKPGGSNPTSGDAGVNTYDPEELEVFEVGMKNTLMDGRLQLNVYTKMRLPDCNFLRLLEDLL